MKTPARRATTALTSLLVAAAGVVATGAATPAHAAPKIVSDATFVWDLNNEATAGAFAPGTWNLMSAGRIGDPGVGGATLTTASNGALWSNGAAAGWTGQAGNVTVQDLKPGGAYTTATFGDTRVNSAGLPASPVGNARGETRLAFGAGSGTVDPETDDASIAWDGDATLLFYSGMTFFYLSDPVLTLSGGVGKVEATVGGYATSQDDMEKWTALEDRVVTVATLTGVDVTEDGLEATPAYREVQYAPTGDQAAQTRSGDNWGAFPQSFVEFQHLVGQGPYWYSTGGSADPRKPANPLAVELGPLDDVAASTATITSPGRRFGQAASVVVTVATSGTKTGTVTLTGVGPARTQSVVDGRATFALGTPAAKTYALTATYTGSRDAAGSIGRGNLAITKAATAVTTKVTKKPTRKKSGTLKVTVSSGTTTPTGKVKVVLKKGTKAFKTINATLKNRTATVTLPKKAKSAYRAVVTYAGNTNVGGSTRTASYRITR